MGKLNARQRAFIDEYLIDLNGTQAAIRAGYSPKSSKEQGSELLANPDVRARVDAAIADRSRRTGINADLVLQELARIARVNAAGVIDQDTACILPGATEDDTAAISSVKVKIIPTKDGDIVEREIKLHDKIKALELLAKHLGMLDKKVQADTPGESGVVLLPPVTDEEPPAK